jgi:protein O-mannosyl-transferase
LIVLCLSLAAITLVLYLRVGNFQFLNMDDNLYVTNNPHVASGLTAGNIVWALTTFDYSYWHPVTWLSHMIDVQLYGMNPGGHHVTSVLLHALASVLLLLTLLRMTGALWKSALVAALFALHPTHVESVAWVAERKDVLSALFMFLTLFCYAEFTARRKPALYLLALLSFLLGLMSKPMLVTLPVVMLMLDFWPLERCSTGGNGPGLSPLLAKLPALIKEKIPFFACSLFSGLATIYGQHKFGAMDDLQVFPLPLRLGNALVSYVKYLWMTLWPSDLAAFYPFPRAIPLWQSLGSLAILLVSSAAALRYWRRFPYLAVGWFWFLIVLVPVIGLTQVGNQAMADRFCYLPGIGLLIAAVWGVADLTEGLQHRERILALGAGTVLVICTCLSWRQIGYWRDNVTLYRHSLQVTGGNNFVYGNLGAALIQNGDWDGAIETQREAIRLSPLFVDAHHNLGIALAQKGDQDGAIREYQVALGINPSDPKLHYNLGLALAQKGDRDAAIRQFQETLRINPADPQARYNLARTLAQQGSPEAAIQQLREALRQNPNDPDLHISLGVALANKGDLDAAIREYQAALRLDSRSKDAYNNLGVALVRKGDLQGAVGAFRNALAASPNDLDAHSNLGVALIKTGDLEAGIREFREVLRLSPGDNYARDNLERALAQKGGKVEPGR